MLSRVSESPRLDAELLLEYVTGLSRTAFRTTPERGLPAQAGWAFQQLVMRRLKGEPIAYIRGQQEFWSLLLEVTPAVLIPRPETELVVERALEHLAGSATARVLDLGTGSGAIALALANQLPAIQMVASDASKEALAVAARNAGRLQVTNVTFMLSNWFAALPEALFDVIVSNPPYVAANDPDLSAEVRRTEPGMALIPGPTGFEAIESIVRESPRYLAPNGWLVLEHGWKQAATVRDLLVRTGFTHVRSHADLAGHERVTEARRETGQER